MTHNDQSLDNNLGSVQALHDWLAAQGIDVSKWGRDKTKSVTHLWHELRHGEAHLQADPPLRRVDVAQIIIRRQDRVLVEMIQEFGDGQRRFRNQPPSEKMQGGETYLDAAHRCLQEELGVSPHTAVFHESTYQQKSFATDSYSYPGLSTRYTLHRMEAAVPTLPSHDFWRENVSEHQGDPVRRHFWSWQEATGDLGWRQLIDPAE